MNRKASKSLVNVCGAGVAAALAAKRGIAVQDLPYPDLRERLVAQGQVLALPQAGPASPPQKQPGSAR